MSKSIDEQIKAVGEILGKKTYCIKGKVFPIKEDLKRWGWKWSPDLKLWILPKVAINDMRLKVASGIEGTKIEVLK